MIKWVVRVACLATVPLSVIAQGTATEPALSTTVAAERFGARESVADISLSPDGNSVAYVAPRSGQGNALYTVALATGEPRLAMATDGKPLRLAGCDWVSNVRLICTVFAYQKSADQVVTSSRLVGVNAGGTDLKLVSQLPGSDALYSVGWGGSVLDLLPGEENSVLIERYYVPESRIGSLREKRDEGLGVDRIDTRTLKTINVEPARRDAVRYMSDGRGKVRIMAMQPAKDSGYAGRAINFLYRLPDAREWLPMNSYDVLSEEGFYPLAIDAGRNMVYGLKKKDGRKALYSVLLDGSLKGALVFAHPQVDIDDVVRIGRHRQVVGATFATDKRQAAYFEQEVAGMAESLARALPASPQNQVLDASRDGTKMLLWAGSDVDPGQYFLFDRTAKKLNKILLARPQLDGVGLAPVKPVSFRATDGTAVPAYLTLPPGSNGKGLPAVVLPHGGPEARDEWGFDWMAQFYANRGYAVLQPNYRGSTGYGDAWFQNNGFKSWRAAVGDVVDAGRWLVAQGIADPAKLGIVGWSYGGYAALQSNVIAPDLFKAVVAIAPVTDFRMTIEESRDQSNFMLERERIGSGAHLREGSPAHHVAVFKAPVMLFHGEYDRNVGVRQSQVMAQRLKAAGKPHELVLYPGLDHQLDDSQARAAMLERSEGFLRRSMGMAP